MRIGSIRGCGSRRRALAAATRCGEFVPGRRVDTMTSSPSLRSPPVISVTRPSRDAGGDFARLWLAVHQHVDRALLDRRRAVIAVTCAAAASCPGPGPGPGPAVAAICGHRCPAAPAHGRSTLRGGLPAWRLALPCLRARAAIPGRRRPFRPEAQRRVGHREHVAAPVGDHAHRRRHAGLEFQFVVGDVDDGVIGDDVLHHLRRIADVADRAAELLAGIGIHGERHAHAGLEPADVGLGHVGMHFHLSPGPARW